MFAEVSQDPPSTPQMAKELMPLLRASENGKTIRTLIKYSSLTVCVVAICWCVTTCVPHLAGRQTGVKLLANFVTDFGLNNSLYMLALVFLMAALFVTRKTLKRVIVNVGDHASRLELELDSGKESSGITTTGGDTKEILEFKQ